MEQCSNGAIGAMGQWSNTNCSFCFVLFCFLSSPAGLPFLMSKPGETNGAIGKEPMGQWDNGASFQYQLLVLFCFFPLGLPINFFFPIACFVFFLPPAGLPFFTIFLLFHVLFCFPPSGLPLNISHYSMFCFVCQSPWKILNWGRLLKRKKQNTTRSKGKY